MDNFFAAFGHDDSIAFLLSVLVSFLIGFVTAWLLWSGRAKRYQREAAQWKKSYDELTLQHTALREESDLRQADLVLAQREAQESKDLAAALKAEKSQWQKDLDQALEASVKDQAAINSYHTTVEDLNNQVLGLKARIAELSDGGGAAHHVHAADHDATAQRLSQLEARLSELSNETAGGDDAAARRLEALEAKFNELSAENEALKTKVSELPSSAETTEAIFAAAPETTAIEKGETMALTALAARDEILAANGEAWPTAAEGEKDDLTKIDGIGSFLEEKLNALGICTYRQLSFLTPYWTERLTAAIEYFPGRIERDDWAGQANRFVGMKLAPPVELAAVASKPTDLTIVEGIGPKIAKLLQDGGIGDWAALSETSEKRLREILFAAGSRFRVHDPTSWPEQAALAAKGDWDALKLLQERLKGGKEIA